MADAALQKSAYMDFTARFNEIYDILQNNFESFGLDENIFDFLKTFVLHTRGHYNIALDGFMNGHKECFELI